MFELACLRLCVCVCVCECVWERMIQPCNIHSLILNANVKEKFVTFLDGLFDVLPILLEEDKQAWMIKQKTTSIAIASLKIKTGE